MEVKTITAKDIVALVIAYEKSIGMVPGDYSELLKWIPVPGVGR